MATDSRMAMIGMMMKALPRLLAMSPKETSSGGNVPFSTLRFGMEKGGRAGFGMPPAMSPVSVKVQLSLKKYLPLLNLNQSLVLTCCVRTQRCQE